MNLCPRCTKPLSDSIHTCTPTDAWLELDAERDALKAQVKSLQEQLEHATLPEAQAVTDEVKTMVLGELERLDAQKQAAEAKAERIIAMVCSRNNDLCWHVPHNRPPYLDEAVLRARIAEAQP